MCKFFESNHLLALIKMYAFSFLSIPLLLVCFYCNKYQIAISLRTTTRRAAPIGEFEMPQIIGPKRRGKCETKMRDAFWKNFALSTNSFLLLWKDSGTCRPCV